MASTSQTTGPGEGWAGRNCKPVSGVRRLPCRDASGRHNNVLRRMRTLIASGFHAGIPGGRFSLLHRGVVLAILSGVITVMLDTKVESSVRVLPMFCKQAVLGP